MLIIKQTYLSTSKSKSTKNNRKLRSSMNFLSLTLHLLFTELKATLAQVLEVKSLKMPRTLTNLGILKTLSTKWMR